MGGFPVPSWHYTTIYPPTQNYLLTQAPKVRNIPAQGATLGYRWRQYKIPEAMGLFNASIIIEGITEKRIGDSLIG